MTKSASRIHGRKNETPTLPAKRAGSEELGDPNSTLQVNQRTGRPIRKSAGRKCINPEFVDPAKVIEDEFEGADEFEAEDDFGEDMMYLEGDELVKSKSRKSLKGKRPPKRKRTPSPPPTRLSPEPKYHIRTPQSSPPPDNREAESGGNGLLGTVRITANIPLGFSGPLEIKLDISDLVGTNKKLRLEATQDFGTIRSVLSKPVNTPKIGFLNLPAGKSFLARTSLQMFSCATVETFSQPV
jgi:hypothetical protein